MNKPGQITAMISCTALDLPLHREAAEAACIDAGIFPIWMKHLPARDANGIKVSLEMVDQADIYIGIYAWRYGWVPDFDNPGQISITEMELNRALLRQEEGRLQEVLIFLMHKDHPVTQADVERGEAAVQKLEALKAKASTGRVVKEFNTPFPWEADVQAAIDKLRREKEAQE
jgi:hypothetical protein